MKRPILIAALVVCVNQLPQTALACNCQWSEKRFQEAKTVIYGKLLSAKRDHYKKVVMIKCLVRRAFKGDHSGILIVYSDLVCSYNFKFGHKYLIYAGQNGNSELETGPCRILYEKLAKEEMKYLEKGQKPRTKLAQSKTPSVAPEPRGTLGFVTFLDSMRGSKPRSQITA